MHFRQGNVRPSLVDAMASKHYRSLGAVAATTLEHLEDMAAVDLVLRK
jgi:hypothetical protein